MNCPVPEEQNTRGRRIHPPEESIHGFGILTMKPIPSVSKYSKNIRFNYNLEPKFLFRFLHFPYILDVVKFMLV